MRLTSLLIFVALAAVACKGRDEDVARQEPWKNALTMCKKEVKAHAFDPATARVPDVVNSGQGSQFIFTWGPTSQPVLMNDGFGATIQLEASCAVDASTSTVVSLNVDGQQFIGIGAQP